MSRRRFSLINQNAAVDLSGYLTADSTPVTITGDWTFPTAGFTVGATALTETKVGQWDTAYSWGDHAGQYIVPNSTSAQADDYLYIQRNNVNPALYVTKGNTLGGPIARFISSTTDGVDTENTAAQVEITADGGIDATGDSTFDGTVYFTKARSGTVPTFELQSSNPQLFFYETGAPTGEACYNMGMAAGEFYFRTMTDARANNVDVMRFVNAGGTITSLQLEVGQLTFMDSTNSDVYIKGDNLGNLRIGTEHDYVDIGPLNTSWCHINTSATAFYMYQDLEVRGGYRVLSHADTSYASGKVTISSSAASGGSNGDIWLEY